MVKIGRNDPCQCGSGKKYKKCCLASQVKTVGNFIWRKMRKTEGYLVHNLLKHANDHYGPEAVIEAWDEFSLWEDVPMDPESQPELDTIFPPWFVFNWIPDNAEINKSEQYPEKQVALHYLEMNNSRLDSFQQRFIENICSEPYSFFMVMDVEQGRQITLKDLLLEREYTVHERQASTTLRKGSIIYTRVLTMDDNSIMVGAAPTMIPPIYVNDIIEIRERILEMVLDYDRDFLWGCDNQLRQVYYDIQDELFNPQMPNLQNTDGDPLQLTKLYYTLKCNPGEALDALAILSMSKNTDEVKQQGKFDQQKELVSVKFPWLIKGNKQHAAWENTVMGHLSIDGDQLTVEVNSQERSDEIKCKITRRLGKRAIFRNAVIQSPVKMLEEVANRSTDVGRESNKQQNEELQAMPEVQEKLKEMSAQHWKAWLDKPLPALKNQTPREAAQTTLGLERLEALLFQFEQYNESPQPFNPDIEALRLALGLDKI